MQQGRRRGTTPAMEQWQNRNGWEIFARETGVAYEQITARCATTTQTSP